MSFTPTRGRYSGGTAASSMMASDDDAMEEASVFTVTSPPRSASKSCAASRLFQGESTPKSSRRLFGDDDDDDDDEFQPIRPPPALTPFNTNPRRRVMKPLQRQDSIESEELTGRKRSSEERRDSNESDVSMHMSPHISPNSYVTLDGRFVTSKNPFSSPMVTEDDNHHIQVTANAPSLPIMFPSSSNSGFSGSMPPATTPASPNRHPPTLSVLPPRQLREKRGSYRDRRYEGGLSNDYKGTTTFLDSRFSFTGSPIPEHSDRASSSMETGIPSGGSFQKVRRLTENDDVVSASGYQLYSSRRRPYLSIDTTSSDISCTSFSDSSTGTWKADDEDSDRISPTDVLSFPPPPTPAKNSSDFPRYRAPPTPVAQRRHERLMQRRTPHPGSILARHHNEHDDETPTVKSRFYDDFDIIQELGKGSFGTVYKVLSRLDGVRISGKSILVEVVCLLYSIFPSLLTVHVCNQSCLAAGKRGFGQRSNDERGKNKLRPWS